VKALFIEHDHVSPPGPVAERLRHHGFEIFEEVVVSESNFYAPNVPYQFPNAEDFDLIIPLGAPWGAWDDGCIGNWLLPEVEWVKSIVESGRPMLGICFGGQLMARAMGGSVAKAPQCEIGWKSIWSDDTSLVSDGPWFQFHYDRWKLPPGATEIARNPIASQAFLIKNSLALQFHPEVDASSLQKWLEWGGDKAVIENGQDPDVMLAQTRAFEPAARERTFALVDAFLSRVAHLI
jgi:GMP synthase-like glutamine amidotransferase